jgi:two-component system, OmpR family, alkaline phosphatase synthesis response regulator PhoP
MVGKVLIIDDSRFLRRANELALSKAGYTVIVAADGNEGLALARTNAPDVIVLDMMLPKLSGQELLRSLKQDSATSSIPVIVLSSLPQCNEQKLKADGASIYFEKSKLGIDGGSAVLVEAIESVLHVAQ